MNEDGTFTHRWEYTAPERPLSKTWYALSGSITVESADAFKRLADALKGVFDTLRKASHLLRLLQSPRQRKYARERVRCEHAYKRQAAAIVAKMNTPKPEPADKPIRLGEDVRLQPRQVLRLAPRPMWKGKGVTGIKTAYREATVQRDEQGRGRIRKVQHA